MPLNPDAPPEPFYVRTYDRIYWWVQEHGSELGWLLAVLLLGFLLGLWAS